MGDAEAPVMETISQHSGAAFEAGRIGRPRGEYMEGVEPNDIRDDTDRRHRAPAGATETTLQQMLGAKRGLQCHTSRAA